MNIFCVLGILAIIISGGFMIDELVKMTLKNEKIEKVEAKVGVQILKKTTKKDDQITWVEHLDQIILVKKVKKVFSIK